MCLLFVLLATACGSDANYDRSAISDEVKSKKVRRLTESQIMLEAEKVGEKLAAANNNEFRGIIELYQAKADTVSLYAPQPDSVLNAMKDVYRYAADESIKAPAGIQANTDKLFYYCTMLPNDSSLLVLTLPKKYVNINIKDE